MSSTAAACSARVLAAPRGTNGRVEGHDLGTACVRVDGLEGMYRGEAGVASALLNTVPEVLDLSVGHADEVFPTVLAARTCGAHGAFRGT